MNSKSSSTLAGDTESPKRGLRFLTRCLQLGSVPEPTHRIGGGRGRSVRINPVRRGCTAAWQLSLPNIPVPNTAHRVPSRSLHSSDCSSHVKNERDRSAEPRDAHRLTTSLQFVSKIPIPPHCYKSHRWGIHFNGWRLLGLHEVDILWVANPLPPNFYIWGHTS